ncbi:MalY/PatB family protein [Halovulum sp. GXIMD14793]
MNFNFDTLIDRRKTNSVKWDMLEKIYGVSPEDGIAMWVADMDFRAPPAVTQTLKNMAEHGLYGYFGDDRAYKASIIDWMRRRQDWRLEPDWIETTHGLVNGTAICVQAFTKPGDGVILFTPVYHAFSKVLKANGRKIVESELVNNDGRYEMDLDALAAKLTKRDKMVILCSPHNPSGRIWSVDELRKLADFCAEHKLLLLSDEIHHDLVFDGHGHTVLPNAAPEHMDRIIMLTAASKTFNLAGGQTGNVIISDPTLREKFRKVNDSLGHGGNLFGFMMTTAAYAYGEDWLEALLRYLNDNRKLFDEGINAIPGVKSMEMASTYLAWVDFADTGMSLDDVLERVQGKARVVPNHGPTFGKGGETFLRFNFATPRPRLREAISRLQDAFSDLQ